MPTHAQESVARQHMPTCLTISNMPTHAQESVTRLHMPTYARDPVASPHTRTCSSITNSHTAWYIQHSVPDRIQALTNVHAAFPIAGRDILEAGASQEQPY
eukprot:25417-Pelagomonas_calceolata.AAC.3